MIRPFPFILFGKAGPLPPGISIVQKASYGSTTQSTTHTIGATQGWVTPTSGNLLLLYVVGDATTTGAPAGWTLVTSGVDFTGTYIYRKISAGTETSVTVTLSGTNACCLALHEIDGVTTQDKVDNNIGQGTASVTCGPTTATAVAVEFAVALVGLSQGNTTVQPTVTAWSNGYTQDITQANSGIGILMRLIVSYKILSVTGTQTTVATLSAAGSANNSGCLATFS